MKQHKSAFTLIELLVVIAIIAILAAILFPVLSQARLAAKKTADLNQVKQIALSIVMYNNDNDDVYLSYAWAGNGSQPDYGPHWADRVQPYIKNRQIMSDASNRSTLYNYPRIWKPGAQSLADTNTARFYRVGYTFNHLISQSDDPVDSIGATSGTAIPAPSDTVLIGPANNWFSWSTCRRSGNTVDMLWNVSASNSGWGYEFWGGTEGGGYAGGTNFGYADGRAAFSKLVKGGDNGNAATSLYTAAFVNAKTRPEVANTGICPSDYGSSVIGY